MIFHTTIIIISHDGVQWNELRKKPIGTQRISAFEVTS